MKKKACIIYPTDPFAAVPGGIDTYIRDSLSVFKKNFEIDCVGISIEEKGYQLQKWNKVADNNNGYKFFPVSKLKDLNKQKKLPLSLSFNLDLLRHRVKNELNDYDILIFHKIEHVLPFLGIKQKKILFIHNSSDVLDNPNSDIRWKYFRSAYYFLEKIIFSRVEKIFCVRTESIDYYKLKYPTIANKLRFLPTWFNDRYFFPVDDDYKKIIKKEIFEKYKIKNCHEKQLLLFIGRFDYQKQPLLLLESVKKLLKVKKNIVLFMVGDGVLYYEIKKFIKVNRLYKNIFITGTQPPSVISTFLQCSDLLLLPSAYEGMPMAIMEALATGVPVAASNVGEIKRVVRNNENGKLIDNPTSETYKNCLIECLNCLEKISGSNCIRVVSEFRPILIMQNFIKEVSAL